LRTGTIIRYFVYNLTGNPMDGASLVAPHTEAALLSVKSGLPERRFCDDKVGKFFASILNREAKHS
jgi:hypothetical protein